MISDILSVREMGSEGSVPRTTLDDSRLDDSTRLRFREMLTDSRRHKTVIDEALAVFRGPKSSISVMEEMRRWVPDDRFARPQFRVEQGVAAEYVSALQDVEALTLREQMRSLSGGVSPVNVAMLETAAQFRETSSIREFIEKGDTAAMGMMRDYYLAGLASDRSSRRNDHLTGAFSYGPVPSDNYHRPADSAHPRVSAPEQAPQESPKGSTRNVLVGLDVLIAEPEPTQATFDYSLQLPEHVFEAVLMSAADQTKSFDEIVVEAVAAHVGVDVTPPPPPKKRHLKLVR